MSLSDPRNTHTLLAQEGFSLAVPIIEVNLPYMGLLNVGSPSVHLRTLKTHNPVSLQKDSDWL